MSSKNPDWTRDELILVLDFYLKNKNKLPSKKSPEIASISKKLNEIRKDIAPEEYKNFRNINGVYMKLMNFRSLDPEYTKEGKKGLKHGANADAEVWKEFTDSPERLSKTASLINVYIEQPNIDDEIIEPEEEAEEGKLLTKVHTRRERNRKIVNKKKLDVLKKTGFLKCEVCEFDFKKFYGEHGDGFIEVHHLVPLHSLQPGQKTKLSDLAVLCANCHRMVHKKKSWLSIDELKAKIQK